MSAGAWNVYASLWSLTLVTHPSSWLSSFGTNRARSSLLSTCTLAFCHDQLPPALLDSQLFLWFYQVHLPGLFPFSPGWLHITGSPTSPYCQPLLFVVTPDTPKNVLWWLQSFPCEQHPQPSQTQASCRAKQSKKSSGHMWSWKTPLLLGDINQVGTGRWGL